MSRIRRSRRERSGPARRVLAALLTVTCTATAGAALAFHDGGVAACSGCHVMHETSDGLIVASAASGLEGLLLAESPSDVCLRCHARETGAVLGADPLNPPVEVGAGNFVFLLENNLNDGPSGAVIPGDAAGHNLVAPGHGLAADTRFATSPGGSFPAREMGCTSCHDPHGNANFRLLWGVGPVQNDLAFFSSPAPEALGIELDTGGESNERHTAYQRGMSAWCGNCHRRFHQDSLSLVASPGGRPFEHPSDEPFGIRASSRYNLYHGEQRPSSASQATAYLAAVPFEAPTNTTSSTLGPASSGRVMCLTCHRAHATSSPAAGRWDFRVGRLAEDGMRSGSFPIPNPYNSPGQGPLCSKCHEPGAAAGELIRPY